MTANNATSQQRRTPTHADIKHARVAVEEIANLALRARHLLGYAVGHASGDSDAAGFAAAADALVAQIGWAADHCCGKLDGTGVPDVVGGAEQWLMPPVYHEASESAQA